MAFLTDSPLYSAYLAQVTPASQKPNSLSARKQNKKETKQTPPPPKTPKNKKTKQGSEDTENEAQDKVPNDVARGHSAQCEHWRWLCVGCVYLDLLYFTARHKAPSLFY